MEGLYLAGRNVRRKTCWVAPNPVYIFYLLEAKKLIPVEIIESAVAGREESSTIWDAASASEIHDCFNS